MPTISECLDRFEVYLQHERGRKPETITGYRSSLKLLYERYPVDVSDITTDDLRAYVRHLHMRGLKYRTIERHRAAFSTFWRWLMMENITLKNPVEFLQLPKRPPTMPKWLEESDLRRFAETPDKSEYRSQRKRNECAWLMLALMGLRRSEVINLRVRDVMLRSKLIAIRQSKADGERILPMPDILRARLKRQIADKSPEALVFLGNGGGKWSLHSFSRQFKSHARYCGLPTWVTPHIIRHSYATNLIRRGVSIFDVQKMLGHKDIKTTLIYLHISPDHLRGAAEKHVLND
ncbi:MAG: tyrosine-type recombinase/integrase [Anaerolineae bacterium]|nr:tyrosine-type recombinase/integrase [Anaerolineae bacterium]